MKIRRATENDCPAILKVCLPVFRAAETYPIDPGISEEDALAYWFEAGKEVFVAEIDGAVLGVYYIKPNNVGGGKHICNCGYMTRPDATGKGIASAMCTHSLDYAKSAGFKGMQFNFVISTNHPSIRLWKKFGFDIVGALPKVFHHPTEGYVDAFVMFRTL